MLINMLRIIFSILLYVSTSVIWVPTAVASADHDHDSHSHKDHTHKDHTHKDDDHQDGEHDDHSTAIKAAIAQQAGVQLASADSGAIERHLQVYGRLITPPTHQVQVRARFPGVVTSLHANTGDAVKKGDLLAVVESNESLRRYEIRAAITGMVQERLINQSEITTDAPLFTLLNQEQLWAELSIFPSQRASVKAQQPVHIRHNGHDHQAQILSLVPPTTAHPYVIARVPLTNEFDDMAQGDYVLADIDIELVTAKVRIEKSALQEMDGQWVVFVHQDERYTAVPVTLGVSDDRYTEILSGLEVGTEYVVRNSYLIKADLGKSAAEHEH